MEESQRKCYGLFKFFIAQYVFTHVRHEEATGASVSPSFSASIFQAAHEHDCISVPNQLSATLLTFIMFILISICTNRTLDVYKV